MSLIDRAVEKARTLRGMWRGKPQHGTHTNAIKHDRMDEWTYQDLMKEIPVLRDDVRELNMQHDQVGDFHEDMFNMLHQGDPTARTHKDMDAKHKANVDLVNHAIDLPEVMSLRHSTMFDKYASAMGLRSLKDPMRQWYELTEAARQQYQDAQDAADAADKAAGDLDALLAQAGGMDPGDPGEEAMAAAIEAAAQALQDAQGISDQALADAMAAAEQAAKDGEEAIGQAAKDTEDELDAEKKRAAAFGVEDGELKRMSFEERRALAEKLSHIEDVDAFVKMIGQGANVEMGEYRQRVTNNPDEITSVHLSDDLAHLTSGEYMNLAIPEMEDDFWRRMAEDRLFTYQLSGVEKLGKGPMICVADESGSTGGAIEQFFSAMAGMMMKRCQRDKRDFIYIGFSSRSQQFRKDFPEGKSNVDDLIDVVTHFFGGGTHYEEPLMMAAQIVEEYADAGKDKPDIVFMSDDAYREMPEDFLTEFNRVKKRTDMRVFGILVGSGTSGALQQVSDNVRTLSDVSNFDGVRDIFRAL